MMNTALPQEVDTPCIVIDLALAERNARRLADYARQHGLMFRPHAKTHKSLKMAELQLHSGAVGLTVAKVGEAEIMSQVCPDLLLAYPVVDPSRARRVAALARRAVMRVAVDSLESIDVLAAAAPEAGSVVGILIDLDVGFHRTGVASPAIAAELAGEVAARPGLRFDGLFFYPGHVLAPAEEQAQELARIDTLLGEALDRLKQRGLHASIISGGSTPTLFQSHQITRQNEIRPGTSLYNDMNTVRGGFCTLEDCAAVVAATVVSTAVPGKVVIDAGTKALTSDRNTRFPDSGHGHVFEYPQARIVRLSEEHGELDVSGCDRSPRIGERVSIIPNHICPCINLFDTVYLKRPDGVLEALPIDARGKCS